MYYWLVLRNKRFHRYNRFYILGSLFVSFLIPVIKIQLENREVQKGMVQLVYVLADYHAGLDAVVSAGYHRVNWYLTVEVVYGLISIILLIVFIRALVKIFWLLKTYPHSRIGDVCLVLTPASGTPFTFFRFIFWNNEIDLQSVTGQQIFQHEVTHVKEKHSVDMMIMQLVLVIGWINPFFWLAKKELYMIHEFTADSQSLRDGDTASFAAMLLAAVYPGQQYLLTHSFFFSPIKRRLFMLTNNKNPRYSYIRRVIALPLMAMVVVLFAFRAEHHQQNNSHPYIIPGSLSPALPLDTLIIRDSTTGAARDIHTKIILVTRDSIRTGKSKNENDNLMLTFRQSDTSSLQPLVILDGKKITPEEMERIDPARITDVRVYKKDTAVVKYGDEGKNGIIVITSKMSQALYVIDGKISTSGMKDIHPEEIVSVHVWKGDAATVKYGESGKNGVIEITTKKVSPEKNR
jgi:hypothetical protein